MSYPNAQLFLYAYTSEFRNKACLDIHAGLCDNWI